MKTYKPNKYQVIYKVWEEDRTGGGWEIKMAIVETLGDCIKFKNIVTVHHMFHIVMDEIPVDSIRAAVKDRQETIDKGYKQERIAQLKRELEELEK